MYQMKTFPLALGNAFITPSLHRTDLLGDFLTTKDFAVTPHPESSNNIGGKK